MYFRCLGGLSGVGFGFSGKLFWILDESAAKSGVWRGGGGRLWEPVVVENCRILLENDGF